MLLDQILDKRIKDHYQAGLYRNRRILTSAQSVQIRCDNKNCISFASNDYLGLANHPAIVKAFKNGVDHYGVGSGSSQVMVGHSYAHKALEETFAEFLQRDRALLFSNGYMANLGTIGALVTAKDCVYEDKHNHASLLDAAFLARTWLRRYKHNDIDHLKSHLVKQTEGLRLIVTDAVFSMSGDIAPIPELVQIAKQHNAWLMVDDAHGIGIFGKTGRGTLEYFNYEQTDVPILVCPLGKAMGCFGAIVAGSHHLIENIIQFARTYIYTTAIPPALACAAKASLQMVKTESWRREKLLYLVNYFKNAAYQRNIIIQPSHTPIQILVVGSSTAALSISDQLFNRGFLVPAIRPPTVPKNSACLRINLNCLHQEHQIDYLLDCLASILEVCL